MNNILQENINRHNKLFPYYNPLTGEGSLESRKPFIISENISLMLPLTMYKDLPILDKINERGGLHIYTPNKDFLKKKKQTTEQFRITFLTDLNKLRLKYDFEFFCYTQIRISDKEIGSPVKFKLRFGQRKLLHELEKMRLANLPIRIILDKARQWGGSTLTQIYMLWIQCYHRSNWNSVIGTDVLQQADTIRAMYEFAIEQMPQHPFTISNDKHVRGAKLLSPTGCQIRLGSMQKPKTLRSGSYKMAHFSETALWTTTDRTKPEELISSIITAIPLVPYTIVVSESTAKGEGNFFHRQWLSAIKGESGFTPVFVAWWEIEIYSLPFKNDQQAISFYNTLDEYGLYLWKLGATLEGIHWYYTYKKTNSLDEWQMHEEYPSTWQESFIASGERVIPLKYMATFDKNISKPKFIGDITADARSGKEALNNIDFVENSKNGNLSIWDFPEKNNPIAERYVVCMDIGGTSAKADYTVIRVIDRYWRTEDGQDEFVATWRGHMDVDLAVWKAAQLSKVYDNAKLVVESNTIDSKFQHTEGEHSYTVFDEIAPFYKNIYRRKDTDNINQKTSYNYGFFTSHKTKSTIITNLIKEIREQEFIEHDIRMIEECNEYEWKDSKVMGAKDGCHDDILMASAIGLYVSSKMPKPYNRTQQNNILPIGSAMSI